MGNRPAIDVVSPPGGWGAPWPNVAEIEQVLPHEKWTLVGGLMAQLYAIHNAVDRLRPTNDVDIVLHVETTRGVASEAARALESIGYSFAPSLMTATTSPTASLAETRGSIWWPTSWICWSLTMPHHE